ncbi:M48 family metallopeptidase [Pedosphaera parvula]|uniref:Ste24 endopeptidase n=1 Tax=Pedosphaera parvula (strain Ellin514) TaxID=320771 RepID=B9XD75_PEDPL|nr:M48 family metallopeptidase [Pedosphaera parvula]EEF62021.1 Ste24 endopeptidase [Pedosphaera parvula Ellin514]
MSVTSIVTATALILILARWLAQLWLARLNQKNVLAHANEIPRAFEGTIDRETYHKSVQYTLAKSKYGQLETTYELVVFLLVLFTGVLPWAFGYFTNRFGTSAWSMAAFLFCIMIALSIPSLPFDWYGQFHLEQRFGFNTSTPRLWIMDRVKGLVLGFVIGWPLLVLVLKIVDWTGTFWWLWAWGVMMVFQLIMLVLTPILIMPLFNKFTPLPEGSLRERLLGLGQRTGFHAKSIQVMDGSKRSRHSNAFFTGFGQFRKIVLFDTLIQQLTEPELEAVLAHEIGHYKKKHIPKMLLWSTFGLLVTFYLISLLARQEWFYRSFGFEPGSIVPALLLFALLAGVVTFWFSPIAHWWSRRHEYQADAYAAETMKEPQSLIGALRKLNEKNLSNLTPHPWYSGFYYSHPTLLEREQALLKSAARL